VSKRTILLLAIGAIAALIVGMQVAFAAAGISGTFESADGNEPRDTATIEDWANVATPANLVVKNELNQGALDESFGQGTKEDTAVPTVVDGSIPPNKSDLTLFKVYKNKGSDGHDYLYLEWQRTATLGSANMDFEFNQSTKPSANGVTPERTAGDILITYDFASGGNVVQFGLLKWVTSGANSQCEANGATTAQGCWGNRVDLDASGNADGAISSDQKLGEAAIDLTDTVFGGNQCAFLGSAYLKSRSSDSFTAASKDFVAPAPVNISNCGKIIIDKVTDPSGDPQSFNFTLKRNNADVIAPFSLTDASTPKDSGPILPSGGTPYVAAETVPAGWDLTSATCVDSVGPNSSPGAIDLSSGETVTCTFTNTKHTTDLSSEQTFTPQDKAILGGSGGAFSGLIDFELYKGTSCTGTPVYFERDVQVNLPAAGGSVSTTNGDPEDTTPPGTHSAAYDINVSNQDNYRWKVVYDSDPNHPNSNSCVEASNVTIDNDNSN
jgi:hypothetical protein